MPLNPSRDWQIIFELADDWEGHAPYWGYTIYRGEVSEAVGSADDLPTAMSMAQESFDDVQAYKLSRGIKMRATPATPPTQEEK